MPRLAWGGLRRFSLQLGEAMVGLASAAGTLRGSGENRFGCPPPQPPANRSYKYGPAWPGFLILTMREGIAREAGWYKHVNDFRRGLLP